MADLSRRALVVAGLVLGGLLPSSRATACASCGCGDSTLTATGVEKPYKNRVRLTLEERFGAHESGARPSYAQNWTLRTSLSLLWSPIDRLTLMGVLPLQSSWLVVPGEPTQRFTGLSDFELSARGVVWRDRAFSARHMLSVLGGLKMPTGPRLADEGGYPYPADDQPGSGSWDPFAALSYAWFGDGFSAYASVSWRQTTDGWRGRQRGSALGATLGAQVQPTDRVALGLSVDSRWTLADTMPNPDPSATSALAVVANTGGVAVALTPNVLVAVMDPWLLRLAVQVHVWDHWYGVQNESVTVMISTAVDLN